MLLKALLMALSSLLGGLGVLQASAFLESYALLAVGVLLTMGGIVYLADARQPAT